MKWKPNPAEVVETCHEDQGALYTSKGTYHGVNYGATIPALPGEN